MSTDTLNHEQAIEWIAAIFATSPEALTPDTPRSDIPDWDSLGVLTLMASLDTDFGIILSDDEVQTTKSVGDILEILRRNGKLECAS